MSKRNLISSLFIMIIMFTQGCSIISVTQPHYKTDVGQAPREKLPTFENSQALAAGATLNSTVASKVYFKGTEAESKDAKVLWDMSYRFMSLAGVNSDFDATDPESLKKVFAQADGALKQKDKDLADLRESVQDFQKKLEGEKKIVKDKEAEMKANDGKWSARMGSLFYGIIGFIILLFIGALAIQIYTGLPIFSGLLSGSIKTIGKLGKQTVVGVQATIDDMKEKIAHPNTTPEEKEFAEKYLGKLRNNLAKSTDEDTKRYIDKLKESTIVAKGLDLIKK